MLGQRPGGSMLRSSGRPSSERAIARWSAPFLLASGRRRVASVSRPCDTSSGVSAPPVAGSASTSGRLRRQVLAMSDARAQNWYEEAASDAPTLHPALPGLMDLSGVELPSNATVFMCGPLPFMRKMRETLIHRGIPSERINYEVFGPDLWAHNPDANAA